MKDDKLEKKLKIISFLDKARWNSEEDNYYRINYTEKFDKIKENKKQDMKLLTHWLTYITDRQMPFEQIWDVGGYVFSELVYNYCEGENDWEQLLQIDKKGSFFRKDKRKNKDGYAFVVEYPKDEKSCVEKLKYYTNNIYDKCLYFKPRYYPNDYVAIYRTLYILAKISNKSFLQYINLILDKAKENEGEKLNEEEMLLAIADGLYFLTYEDCKKKDSNLSLKKHIEDYIKKIANITDKNLKNYLNDKKRMTKTSQKYKNKRLWCSIRDYIKTEELNIKDIIEKNDVKIDIKDLEKYLELPGDVWNNNEKFSDCFFSQFKYLNNGTSKYKIVGVQEEIGTVNEFLRILKNTDEQKEKEWYPEQFDVTFNLASNSCSHNKCDFCPFGLLNAQKKLTNKVKDLCIKNKEKYCPVVMQCCGYAVKCNPAGCPIKDAIKNKEN